MDIVYPKYAVILVFLQVFGPVIYKYIKVYIYAYKHVNTQYFEFLIIFQILIM